MTALEKLGKCLQVLDAHVVIDCTLPEGDRFHVEVSNGEDTVIGVDENLEAAIVECLHQLGNL